MNTNRRQFVLGLSTAAVGMVAVRPMAKILGTNEALRVGVIGFGGRGKELINVIRKQQNARLVALCDADSDVLGKFEPENKDLFRTQDFRELLDRKDIDAIASATPNHWHTLITMLACQAGKHVYIEKPISHNMFESQQVVKARTKFDRIVQCGFQNRSDSSLLPFFEQLHSRVFGKVLHVHGTCHRQRDPIGKLKERLVPPAVVDYDKWLGPAADLPILRPRLHYDWHWDFNTGNGDVGNQGPHEWDLMNWALGDTPELPSRICAAGNRFGWNDAGNTPNVMACHGEMNGIPFCFEVVNLKNSIDAPEGVGVGVIITTEAGTFTGGRGGGRFTFNDGKVVEFKPDPSAGDSTVSHMKNFIDAIASHDRNLQRSECAVAAKSAALSHMANLSFFLGRDASEGEVQTAFAAEESAGKMTERLLQAPHQFAKNNPNVTVAEPWKLGPVLEFDQQKHAFVGDAATGANERMSRVYRKNYQLPAV
ncbi:MAG: Gfo/Idh/MocA family oxidoreductase [Pirellulaceae bacterium]